MSMKKILRNYRYYVLLLLGCLALIGIMAVPAEELPTRYWVYTLISSKVIGFTALYAFDRLVSRWEKHGTIPEFIDAINNY